MYKRKIIILTAFIFIAFIGLYAVFKPHPGKEGVKQSYEEPVEETDEEQRGKRAEGKKIVYSNLEALFFITEEKQGAFRTDLEEWLKKKGVYPAKVEVLPRIDEIPGEFRYIFYLKLDVENYIRGEWKNDKCKYFFLKELPKEVEEAKEAESNQAFPSEAPVTEQEKERVNESYDPTSGNADVGSVVFSNPEKIPEVVEESQLTENTTEFLEKRKEYRRGITIDSVDIDGSDVRMYFSFDIPRVDQKVLKLSIIDDKWRFWLAEQAIEGQ